MKEFDNLKAIWDQQNLQVVPDVSLIIDKAEKQKNSIRNKIIIQVVALLAALIAILFVFILIDFKMTTTFVGIAIIVITIFSFSIFRIYQIKKLNAINLLQSPKIVLQELSIYCEKDKKLKTKGTLLYFVLLNIGMGLYFVEVLQPLSFNIKIICLIVYIS